MRTTQEIYDEIIAEKEQQNKLAGLLPQGESASNLLSDLTTDSKAAIWRLWAWVTAVAIRAHEVVFEQFKSEVEITVLNATAGTPRWYRSQMLLFQYGDVLVYSESSNRYGYAVEDLDLQIVKRAAIEQRADGVVIVKVAKEDADGNPIPLLSDERDALESYAQKIKFAGTRLGVLSLPSDVLDLNYNIYYDPIIPLATIQQNAQFSIVGFQKITPFNGRFNVTKFTDVLQNVQGIVDPVFSSASATPSSGVATSFTVNYVPASGYFDYADLAANMFNWIPQIEQ